MVDKVRALLEQRERQENVANTHEPDLKTAFEDAMRAVADVLPVSQRPDPPLDHFERLRVTLSALHRDMVVQEASTLVNTFKSGFSWLETKEDESEFYNKLFEEYFTRYGGPSLAQISETTRRQIAKIIESGLKAGDSVDEIAETLREAAPVLAEVRAHIIARTETHSAAMFASMESAKRSTIELNKEWVSVDDHRVRDFGEGDGIVDEFSHRAMDGVTVPMDQPYRVPMHNGTLEDIMFPGDPNASAGNRINCRCGQVYVPA